MWQTQTLTTTHTAAYTQIICIVSDSIQWHQIRQDAWAEDREWLMNFHFLGTQYSLHQSSLQPSECLIHSGDLLISAYCIQASLSMSVKHNYLLAAHLILRGTYHSIIWGANDTLIAVASSFQSKLPTVGSFKRLFSVKQIPEFALIMTVKTRSPRGSSWPGHFILKCSSTTLLTLLVFEHFGNI